MYKYMLIALCINCILCKYAHTHIYIILLLINVTKLNLYLSPCSTVPKLVLQWCLKAHGKHQST